MAAEQSKITDIVNMSALGDRFRESREAKNITLTQAQNQTKIHQTVLKAIEEGKCDNILNPTYVKSFLKKYAYYLGMDSTRVLNDYKTLRPGEESKVVNKLSQVEMRPRSFSFSVPPILKIAVVLIVAAATVFFVGTKAALYHKKTLTPKRSQPLKINRRAAPIKPEAARKVTRGSAVSKKDVTFAIPDGVQLKLLLKVNKDVLVKMKTDGVLLFERVLPKGTAEIFTAGNNINIFTANGQAIELVLNGKPLGSPGKGILKNIEITRSGLKLR